MFSVREWSGRRYKSSIFCPWGGQPFSARHSPEFLLIVGWGGYQCRIYAMSLGSDIIPVFFPFNHWSHQRKASDSFHSIPGAGLASSGQAWFHGRVSAIKGLRTLLSQRGIVSRYVSKKPPIKKTGT